MKAQLFGIALAAIVGVAFTGYEMGCSSSANGGSSSGGDAGSVACTAADGSLCYSAYAGYTCPATTMSGGSCATSNYLGSCAFASGSNSVTEYYYCAGENATKGATQMDFQTGCASSNGKWTAGDIKSCGDGGGTGSSSGSSSGAGDAASE